MSLSADGTAVLFDAPAGTSKIHFYQSDIPDAPQPNGPYEYSDFAVPSGAYTPPRAIRTGKPVYVDGIALASTGALIGDWVTTATGQGRIKVLSAAPAPPQVQLAVTRDATAPERVLISGVSGAVKIQPRLYKSATDTAPALGVPIAVTASPVVYVSPDPTRPFLSFQPLDAAGAANGPWTALLETFPRPTFAQVNAFVKAQLTAYLHDTPVHVRGDVVVTETFKLRGYEFVVKDLHPPT